MDEVEFMPVRVTKYFRNCTDLAIPLMQQHEGALLRRLNDDMSQLTRGLSWKDIQKMMEAEAVSKVTVRKLLHDLYMLAKELSDKSGLHPDVGTVILFRLFLQEPVISGTHKRLLEHVFGSVTTLLQHRVTMVTHDITSNLPDYTISFLKNVHDSTRREMFGKNMQFKAVHRKNNLPDTSCLNEVAILPVSNPENVNERIVISERLPPPSLCRWMSEFIPHSFQQIENSQFEEIRFFGNKKKGTLKKKVEISLDTVGKKVFRRHTPFNIYESKVFSAVYYSNENLLISLPRCANTINIVLLAIVNMYKTCHDDKLISDNKYKAVYLTGRQASAQLLASKLEKSLSVLQLVTGLFIASHHFNKEQLRNSNVIVTTFNTWEAFTRLQGNESVLKRVQLLIVDELNTLEESSGALLEAVVIRTKKQVEQLSYGRKLRVVGLYTECLYPPSADMALFLGVNPDSKTFLQTAHLQGSQNISLIKVKVEQPDLERTISDICFDAVWNALYNNFKVLVFVKNASESEVTALSLHHTVTQQNEMYAYARNMDTWKKFPDNAVDEEMSSFVELLKDGFLILHSQMNSKELVRMWELFNAGKYNVAVVSINLVWQIKTLDCCIIIKETEVFEDLYGRLQAVTRPVLSTILAVSLQKFGSVTIVTTKCDKFDAIFDWLRNPRPVESCLRGSLEDILNTEIELHNIRNVEEGVEWFKRTYLYYRMKGTLKVKQLEDQITILINNAINTLQKTGMIRHQGSGKLVSTELGYIASHHHIGYRTIDYIRDQIKGVKDHSSLITMVSKSPQFTHSQGNKSELKDLKDVNELDGYVIECSKVATLLEAHLLQTPIESCTVQLQQSMIVKEALDIFRAMFKMNLNKKKAMLTAMCLEQSKMCAHPHWKVPTRNAVLFEIEASILPITKTCFIVRLLITPIFTWEDDRQCPEYFWLWLEDSHIDIIYSHTYISVSRKHVEKKMCIPVSLHIIVVEPFLRQCIVQLSSDSRVGYMQRQVISFQHMSLPCDDLIITDFLDLKPLPVSALGSENIVQLYSFHHWDPLLTQVYHYLYHSDCNMLVSGRMLDSQKTAATELVIFQALKSNSEAKVIYTNPARSIVMKRLRYWQKRLPCKVAAFESDSTANIETFKDNNVLLCTIQDWEIASRDQYIRTSIADEKISVLILDDIEEIGAATEVVVSRITSCKKKTLRLVGLSSVLLASVADIASFLNISPSCSFGLYNFHHPSPTQIYVPHILVLGFSEKLYSPRMMTMNHTIWELICSHCSSTHPAVVMVPSCRQVVLTAEALLQRVSVAKNPKQWLHMEEQSLPKVQDTILRLMLSYGIGMCHAAIRKEDSTIVQQLFNNNMIQVVVSTSNVDIADFTSHLLVLKGTELYDEDLETYVDMSVQQIGRIIHAFHRSCECHKDCCVSVILTRSVKKNIYQSYLTGPFPVESSLVTCVAQFLNVEIAIGIIKNKLGAEEFLSHSYLAVRLFSNPSYYTSSPVEEKHMKHYISRLTDQALTSLENVRCIEVNKDVGSIKLTVIGKLSFKWNLSHQTLQLLNDNLHPQMTTKMLLLLVCQAQELRQCVVTFVGDKLIRVFEKYNNWKVKLSWPKSSVKVFLLLQYHFSTQKSPELDSYNSCREQIAKQAYKVLHVVLLLCADLGWLVSTLSTHLLLQMIVTGCWAYGDSPLLSLPHMKSQCVTVLRQEKQTPVRNLPELLLVYRQNYTALLAALGNYMRKEHIKELHEALNELPLVRVNLIVYGDNFGHYEVKKFNNEIDEYLERKVKLLRGKKYNLIVKLAAVTPTSWTLVLGRIASQCVLAFGRIHRHSQDATLRFTAPNKKGSETFTLYLLSDSYVGLDQQFNLSLNVL